jgi:hypothetical protein
MSPGRSRRRVSPASYGAEGIVAFLLFFAPLALGGAPEWTLAPLVLLSTAAALLTLAAASSMHQGVGLPLIAAVPALSALLCLGQLIPLPTALLGLLSPGARDLREFALVPLGLTGLRPISLDGAQTCAHRRDLGR